MQKLALQDAARLGDDLALGPQKLAQLAAPAELESFLSLVLPLGALGLSQEVSPSRGL